MNWHLNKVIIIIILCQELGTTQPYVVLDQRANSQTSVGVNKRVKLRVNVPPLASLRMFMNLAVSLLKYWSTVAEFVQSTDWCNVN